MKKKAGNSLSLHTAAENGNMEVVTAILTMLAKHKTKGINAAEATFGLTPLHLAAANGHKQVVELLLASGCNADAKESTGRTPLHSAAFRGQQDVAEVLIANGSNVNAKTNNGKTPLDWAIISHKTEMVTFIQEKGGKPGKDKN